jgi:hypothetical protein
MAKNKKIFCFTHYDLDGAVTFLVTKWAHPGYKIECKALTSADIRQEINQWLLEHNFSDYEKVFFLDMDMSNVCDLIDHENVLVIDHHKSHVDNMKYTKAAPIVKEYPSACLLAYRVFKKLYNTEFTAAQKTLVIYGNDYDSYVNDLKESKMLNVIFWNTQKSFENFIETYSDGYVPFTKEQLAIHRIFVNEVAKITESMTVYQGGHADDDGEYRVVIATFADKHINDIAEYLMGKYDCDVAIVINLKSKHVSFRRPKDGTMKLDIFAKYIADGGGHEGAAGGTITDIFLDFTKLLKPI